MAKKTLIPSVKKVMWECECGFTDYFKISPEECPECGEIGKFIKVPKAIAEEMEEKLLEEEEFY
ncbi:MAG TPA: hypothetical protein VI815_01195 [Candidatus Nanoarchaeia archaeon]|nr:hypothetical protein [Candidatus Nanoarchaeia archaeon]